MAADFTLVTLTDTPGNRALTGAMPGMLDRSIPGLLGLTAEWSEALTHVCRTCSGYFTVGSVSWLKATLFSTGEDGDGGERWIPGPIEALSDILGDEQEWTVVTGDLIAQVEAAFTRADRSMYQDLAPVEDTSQFLRERMGHLIAGFSM